MTVLQLVMNCATPTRPLHSSHHPGGALHALIPSHLIPSISHPVLHQLCPSAFRLLPLLSPFYSLTYNCKLKTEHRLSPASSFLSTHAGSRLSISFRINTSVCVANKQLTNRLESTLTGTHSYKSFICTTCLKTRGGPSSALFISNVAMLVLYLHHSHACFRPPFCTVAPTARRDTIRESRLQVRSCFLATAGETFVRFGTWSRYTGIACVALLRAGRHLRSRYPAKLPAWMSAYGC